MAGLTLPHAQRVSIGRRVSSVAEPLGILSLLDAAVRGGNYQLYSDSLSAFTVSEGSHVAVGMYTGWLHAKPKCVILVLTLYGCDIVAVYCAGRNVGLEALLLSRECVARVDFMDVVREVVDELAAGIEGLARLAYMEAGKSMLVLVNGDRVRILVPGPYSNLFVSKEVGPEKLWYKSVKTMDDIVDMVMYGILLLGVDAARNWATSDGVERVEKLEDSASLAKIVERLLGRETRRR